MANTACKQIRSRISPRHVLHNGGAWLEAPGRISARFKTVCACVLHSVSTSASCTHGLVRCLRYMSPLQAEPLRHCFGFKDTLPCCHTMQQTPMGLVGKPDSTLDMFMCSIASMHSSRIALEAISSARPWHPTG